jgi:hypothetical protein
MSRKLTYDEIVDHLVDWCLGEDRIQALWLEATTLTELRRPYERLEVHVAADEPVYPLVLADLEGRLEAVLGARVEGVADTRRFAKELRVRAGGLPFVLIAEQSHLLAKRPRAEVVPLVDKTRHLPHVLDYSLRRP